MNTLRYQTFFSKTGFWQKLGRRGGALGRGVLEKALYLFYAVQNPDTPAWARRVIYGALGYFILPLDAIPDLAPLVGYTDDLSVMAAALATVTYYITPQVKDQAHARLQTWFPDSAAPSYSTSVPPDA